MAENHPLQPKAQSDSATLAGAIIEEAYWSDSDFVIRLSTGLYLHIWTAGDEVAWRVRDSAPLLEQKRIERVGAAPVIWRFDAVDDVVMDRSALFAKRRGSELQQLFVNEFGLLVYCKRNAIWWFHAGFRTDTGEPVLFVTEGD
jgi:hypothetical protein